MPKNTKHNLRYGRNTVQFPDEEYSPIRELAAKISSKTKRNIGPGVLVRDVMRKYVARRTKAGA